MPPQRRHLETGIAALEALRRLLGDAVVDPTLAAMRAQLQALTSSGSPEPSPALRLVSILFMDVVNSTALVQHLDPEDVGAVLDGVLARGTAIVQAHGGSVLQYAGDSLLAAFGNLKAAEDDAERAVRCGLALLELGRRLAQEAEAAHGVAGCHVRVGVHSGGVLLGGGIEEAGSIRGNAVHIAARMEQAAPRGALRISHDTFAQVRGLFDVEPQAPLLVQGVDEPMQTYLVQRARPRSFQHPTRGVEGVKTRMIGRDTDFAAVQAAFDRIVAPGARLERVLVVADAGVGKSRLLQEFARWAQARAEPFITLQARATPQSQGIPYGLLRDLFASRLGILDDDSMALACRKFEDGLVPLFVTDEGEFEAQAHAHLLGQLIGLDFGASRHLKNILADPQQVRNRGLHAAAQALRRLCLKDDAPILLLLEDLHWADDGSLDFLDLLARTTGDAAILLLEMARPVLFERRADHAVAVRIELQPLAPGLSRLLASELLRKLPSVPDALRDRLADQSAGNPFYMEELVKMLVDRGTIRAADRWTLAGTGVPDLSIPATLTGVLQARLDGLPAAERHALQLASVIGQQFWDAALAHLDTQAAQQLPSLSQRELVRPEDQLGDVQAYAFGHQILHQVTYDTVLKPHKRAAHAKAAQWLAQYSGSRAQSLLARAAEHFDLAGDSARAAEYYERAAAYHAARYAHAPALECCARALKLVDAQADATDASAALRWRLLLTRERTLHLLGRRDQQRQDIAALQVLANALPPGAQGDRQRAESACRHSEFAFLTGDWATAEREARRGMALAEVAGDNLLALTATFSLALALAQQYHFAPSTELAAAGLARATALGWPGMQARMATAMANCAAIQRLHHARLQHDLLVLSCSREAGDRVWEGAALRSLGAGYLKLGAYVLARRHLEAALPLVRSLGDRLTEGRLLSLLCDLALIDGDAAEALALEQSAVDILQALNAPIPLAYGLVNLGRAEQALGHGAAAREALERSASLARELEDPDFLLRALHAQLELAREAGEPRLTEAAAQRLFDEAAGGAPRTVAEVLAEMEEPAYCLTLHQVWLEAGDPRAEAALVEARATLMRQADTITDAALREGYLTHIAAHRQIAALWSARAELA